jgi:arsenate reductase (thioredoxin)
MKLPINILVLCTGNSARSLLGEALLNHHAHGRWQAFSAGSHPKGVPHPVALTTLAAHGVSTAGLRSKSWDEFSGPNAPQLDLVITVCDNAAGEVCPIWHGAPIKLHWGIPDPAAVTADDAAQRAAFATAYNTLLKRVMRMAALDVAALDATQLRSELAQLATVY